MSAAFMPGGHEVTRRCYVVDRVEGPSTRSQLVLVDDDGGVHTIAAASLPPRVVATGSLEGAVLRVPMDGGRPDWGGAERDLVEERRRRDEGQARLERLRRRDPGGDLTL